MVQSLESCDWYYFTIDLNFDGFGVVSLVRFINVDRNRTGAIVKIENSKYFDLDHLLLLPREPGAGPEYFTVSGDNEIRSVWTFDGTTLDDSDSADLKSEWPRNILDKAIVTPFKSVLSRFGRS